MEEYFSQKIIPGETLLIFDEIQACERALASLKYFCEEAPEYHVVAAGSLLGVATNREAYSFPVGKVIMKTLYPLRFDEFLQALGQKHLVSLVREHYTSMEEMPKAVHQELLYWYDRYLFIGGMPAAELDFVIQKEGKILPVEVKAGENVHARSMKHFQKLVEPEKMIRLSRKNFGTDGNICAIPLYAAFCL